MKRFLVSIFAMCCGLCVDVTYGQSADMPVPTSFSVGDTWESRTIDSLTKIERSRNIVTVVENSGVLQFSTGKGAFPMSRLYEGPQSKKPRRVWPLEVGKKWTVEEDWVNPLGQSGNTKQEAQVVGFEEVSVPAGKFMAFRIELRGYFRNGNSQGKQNDTFWYSPEVKMDVKGSRDVGYDRFEWELVSYRLANTGK